MTLKEQRYKIIDNMDEHKLKLYISFFQDMEKFYEHDTRQDIKEALDNAFCIMLSDRHR